MKRFFQAFSIGILARMLLVCLLAGSVFLLPGFLQHAQAATAASVTVNANSSQGVIASSAFGLNAAAWDGNLTDPALPSLLTATGAKIMRYPGGSLSDTYNWETNVSQGSYAAPGNTFDVVMQMAQQAGLLPMITVNYGSGTV